MASTIETPEDRLHSQQTQLPRPNRLKTPGLQVLMPAIKVNQSHQMCLAMATPLPLPVSRAEGGLTLTGALDPRPYNQRQQGRQDTRSVKRAVSPTQQGSQYAAGPGAWSGNSHSAGPQYPKHTGQTGYESPSHVAGPAYSPTIAPPMFAQPVQGSGESDGNVAAALLHPASRDEPPMKKLKF